MQTIVNYFLSLSPEVWAIYITGIIGFSTTIWQLKQNFRLRKRADTFEKLSLKIQQASGLSRTISESTDSIISGLGDAADSMIFDTFERSEDEIAAELERRLKTLESLQSRYAEHSDSINTNTFDIMSIIKDIEKSTILKENTRIAARYLFYEVSEQHELMKAANSILATLQVVPIIGEKPNIQPDTFRAIRETIIGISRKNITIGGYLDDLEIILHNDLVKNVYGPARNETIPDRHLSHLGFSDSRTKKPLV